ncbi:MAG: GTP-binding protein [Sedimentisphaerales bacterium]|nr:GTP-binding protein [Sedimentisphaerales bacterium]
MTCRAALITPSAPAALAVIRLVGPDAQSVTKRIFRPRSPSAGSDDQLLSGQLIFGSLIDHTYATDDEEIIDQVVIARNSDAQTIDINCHGGPRIVQRLLMLLQKHDVEIVSWDELADAASIADEVALTLPRVLTRMAVLALTAQHPTGLYAWAEKTIAALRKEPLTLSPVKKEIQKLLPTYDLAHRLFNPPTVVLTGPVNTGKSTLANTLTGKAQSLTSDIPGATRDWTSQLTDINGIPINLIDTAGRRDGTDSLEEQSLFVADKKIAYADLIILIIEADGCENERIADQKLFLPTSVELLIVVNKCDLPHHPENIKNHLNISALTGNNLDLLRTAIAEHLGFIGFDPLAPLIFTPRQFALLNTAANATSSEQILATLKNLLGS